MCVITGHRADPGHAGETIFLNIHYPLWKLNPIFPKLYPLIPHPPFPALPERHQGLSRTAWRYNLSSVAPWPPIIHTYIMYERAKRLQHRVGGQLRGWSRSLYRGDSRPAAVAGSAPSLPALSALLIKATGKIFKKKKKKRKKEDGFSVSKHLRDCGQCCGCLPHPL